MQSVDNNKIPSPIENELFGVSVVMSVYDQEHHVKKTIDSVLAQTDIEFEFIIVDDGASDEVKEILETYDDDSRVVILEQENRGLTKALITGCEHARYDFIARIDAGDEMAKNRLFMQANILINRKEIGVVCSWVKVVTEEGYSLYESKPDEKELNLSVKSTDSKNIVTPFHSSVMMHKSTYELAGGYRAEFYFSQDLDLWARMALHCKFFVVPELLTIGLFSHRGISGQYREAQELLTKLIVEANQLRSLGMSDNIVLKKAQKIRPDSSNGVTVQQSDFHGLYFLASCLSRQRSKHAKVYWWRALAIKPQSILSWMKLIISLFYQRTI